MIYDWLLIVGWPVSGLIGMFFYAKSIYSRIYLSTLIALSILGIILGPLACLVGVFLFLIDNIGRLPNPVVWTFKK